MINTLLRGMGSGFGRVFGRIIAYIFIGFVVYLLLKYFDIDVKDIIQKGGSFL